jgi:long-chain acyl-CoA synthetase
MPSTLSELYLDAIERHDKPDAFQVKREGAFRPVSSREFAEAGREIALGLVALGMERGDRIGLLSETRLEWAQADMGILTAGLVNVPVYPTLTAKTVEYILEDASTRVLFAADPEQAAKADRFAAGRADFRVVLFEGTREGAMTFDELRQRGRRLAADDPELYRKRAARTNPDDLATLIYTSGTTGRPKGVMLSHRNIVSNVKAGLERIAVVEGDTALSFLPLSHILERMAGLYLMVEAGVSIAYAESVDAVADNMREVRPTVMVSVPRLYEKIYSRIFDAAMEGGAAKRNIFFWAERVGLARAKALLAGKRVPWHVACQFAIADRMVFAKLRARTGGRLRLFVSGGAPLAPEIAEFFYAAGLPILEGYGLTETSPVIAVNTFEELRIGTVGKPVPGVDVRIAEDGEIVVRGPNVMLGYYNLPEETAETVRDGWLYTGDIGHLDEDGYLAITDRKKDLLVTAGGKNVAPQPIENNLKTDPFITNAVVIGDKKPYLVALIVPDFQHLESYARIKGFSYDNMHDLVNHPRVQDVMRRRIDRHQAHAASFESIKKFHILDRELTIEADELTPTLKVKRKEVIEKFAAEIEALYRE